MQPSRHLTPPAILVDRSQREALKGHRGFVVWFTGLSGAGKSTLAHALDARLHRQGIHTCVLDGDPVRRGLNRDLGFTDDDRRENIRRVAEVARLMSEAGLGVLTAFISPGRAERALARSVIGVEHFVEVHVSTPLEECERRDVKKLYQKARQGLLSHMTGIDSPYEAPLNADLSIDTRREAASESLDRLQRLLQERRMLALA